MLRIVSAIFIFFILSCELHNTISLVMVNSFCNQICMSGSGKCSQNDKPANCPLFKSCADCCYYIPPSEFLFSIRNAEKVEYLPMIVNHYSSWASDCFHPPEV